MRGTSFPSIRGTSSGAPVRTITASHHCEDFMFGLTALGVFHTAVSLVAVCAGVASFVATRRIAADTRAGRVYIVFTIVTCLTAFGIFQHGGFGKPHALGVITLITLAIAGLAGRRLLFGRAAPYVETVAYSATFFFHIIPAMAESATRLPPGAPLLQSPDDPVLQLANGICFALFLVGAAWQVHGMRRQLHPLPRFRGMRSAR
jgi:hypothetical protein